MTDYRTNYQTDYPECKKMKKVREKSQVIGDFLQWLQEGEVEQNLPLKRSIFLAAYCVKSEDHRGRKLEEEDWELGEDIVPYSYNAERLLAEFFDIDLAKVEKERQEILEDVQKQNSG